VIKNSSNFKYIHEIVRLIKVNFKRTKISLHEPCFNGNEWKYLKNCLDSNEVSTIGKYVNIFEGMLCDYTKSKYCISTVNGTSALHVAMILSNIGLDDQVLMPAFNFVATANAARYLGANPIFVDIEHKTLGIDPEKLKLFLKKNTYQHNKHCINKRNNKVIKALVLLHAFGHPSNISEILKIVKNNNIQLIEDAAEAIGSKYYDKHVGTFGDLGIISFNGNKTITTGGGGAILTNSSTLAKRAKHITTTSKINHPWKYNHDQIGFNYRMPNINAAIGCAQLEQLEGFIKKKRTLFSKYKKIFSEIKGIKIFEEPKNCRSNYWLNALIFEKTNEDLKNKFISLCHKRNILVRPVWELLNNLKHLKTFEKDDLLCSKEMYSKTVNLPSSVFL
jgi:perosamine synthetase